MKEHNTTVIENPEKSFPSSPHPIVTRIEAIRRCLRESIGLPFASLLPEEVLEETLKAEKISYRKRLFCPIVTLWTWLSAVLDPDKSCKKALARVIAYLAATGQEIPSTQTSAYCQARKRLKAIGVLRLVRKTGENLHHQSPPQWLWCGRRVVVVDGETLLLADTKENQQEYPQHKTQKKGCGFPIARIATLFGLSTGAVIDAALSSLKTGEVNLFRQFYSHLQPGEVALGDRMFGSYADISELARRGVDSVFRLHGRRKCDFRTGKRLGHLDPLVMWQKPKQCPPGLSHKQFEPLEATVKVREVRFEVKQKGFRTKQVTLVTTLLDSKAYPASALGQLYRLRWQAEISLRHLKTRMQMEFLSSKTPDMARTMSTC